MQRVTISLDEQLAQAFDALSRARGYQTRSEAVRDLVRRSVDEARSESIEGADCVAVLSYVYDHHVRALAERLIELGHEHHDLMVATTHVHLDHDTCLESVMLKGPTTAVRALADRIGAERGVRFAALNLIGVDVNDAHGGPAHTHGGGGHLSPHPG